MRDFWMYILASPSRTHYIGVTSDLEGRIWQHKLKLIPGFTAIYNVTRLVHIERFVGPSDAIARDGTEGVAARPQDRTHRGEESTLVRPRA